MNSTLRKLDDPSRRQFMSGVAKSLLGVSLLPGAALAAGGVDRKIPPRKNPAKKDGQHVRHNA